MNSRNILSEQINGSTKLTIESTNDELTSESKVYAVNWFNLKNDTVYTIYNLLVGPLLYKLGGRLHFKGLFQKRLEGADSDERKMLLLVYYPSLLHFSRLIKKKFFQLVSVLRVMSVKDFNFGFFTRVDATGASKTKKEDNFKYLIHHFRRSKKDAIELDSLRKVLNPLSISLYFSGNLSANIIVKRGSKASSKAPILMDGLIVYETDEASNFEKLLNTEDFTSIKSQFDSNYLALFKRVG